MKRALHVVLLTLVLLSTIEASAAAQKQIKTPQKKPAAVRVYKAVPGPAIAASPRRTPERSRMGVKSQSDGQLVAAPGPVSAGPPREGSMPRAGSPQLDLRFLPQAPLIRQERPEREVPVIIPVTVAGKVVLPNPNNTTAPVLSAPSPSPSVNFPGLDFATWGSGHPPDPVGDVGPNHYIQAVNASAGIYSKSGGTLLAAFNFNALMAQGHFGNLCDTNNFGDPIILYDTFEDRWILTDFAFQLNGSGDVLNPPGAFQCFAVSKTGDPISGGYNFYSLHLTDLVHDYPKFGIWPDGIYMSANMFGFPATGTFQGTRVWALNKAQMYAGAPAIQVVQFSPPANEVTLLPSNARLQAGTPPAGSPNYFSTVGNFTNAVSTYRFHVDWNRISLSTFDGPFVTIAPASWTTAPSNVPAKNGENNDALATWPMMQNQYTNLGSVESLWLTHTVANPTVPGVAAVRYYQTNVTSGSIAANTTQAVTHAPDAVNRYIPSLAVDRAGNMALGYSASTSTLFPAIRYAGRLATDPLNTLPQTETSLIEGTGSQTGGSKRWGDYSAMSLDPDGCTFWYTNEYFATTGNNWQTRIGSFNYGSPSCLPVMTGTVSGTVTATAGGAPIVGAAVSFGNRTTTTNASGLYSFLLIPSGTYPGITVTSPGYNTGTATTIVVTDGNTTTQNFSLSAAPTSGCLVDTAQADFQTGVPTNTDLASTPDAVILYNPPVLDQQNSSLSSSGNGIDTVNWGGQTFTAGLTGPLARADISVFCSACTGTSPDLTLSLRATSGGLPTGPDLATTTLPGNNSGASGFLTGTFANPATVTAGTTYALVVRPVPNPSAGTYALPFSASDTYANGQLLSSSDSGGTWSGGAADFGFITYVKIAFATSGDFVSALKDANPAPGMTPIWSTLSWTATVPANTSLKFQVAASNSSNGPFNFVGPGGTAATFFTTSGASLSQFYGFRYLKYKAYLATTDTTQTPALNDVTICYSVADCSAPITITATPSQVCASSAGNTASGPAGAASYAWSITNGTIAGSTASQSVTYTAGASGSVGLTLNIVDAAGCLKSASTSVTIPATPTPTVTPSGPTTFCTGGSVTLTSSSATGNRWYNGATLLAGQTNQTYVAATTGNYNVIMSNGSCSSAPSASTAVTVNPIPATPTVTPGGPTTFCAGGSVTLTSSSAAGNQWYDGATLLAGKTSQTFAATATGNYNVVVTANGCSSTPSASTAVTVNPVPASPTVTAGGPTTFCTGGSVTLTSSSATGNQWYNGATLLAGQTNQTYIASTTGNYNVIVTASGCSSAPSASTAVTVNPIPATPTVTAVGPTTFCAGGTVTLTSSSATGNQWYDGATLLVGKTSQTFAATATGNYNVVVTASGCSSAPSASTAVTVNSTPTPAVTPSGPTAFCTGGSVTLTSSSAAGNQWYDGATPLSGQTNQTYIASTNGNYNVVVTANGCPSAPSASTAVTVSAMPPTPAVTSGGPTTFCAGGSVTLTSSSATGNQWYDGTTLLAGKTGQTFAATANGNYNVVVSTSGCSSAASSSVAVTVNPLPPTPTITPGGPTTFCTGGSVTLSSSSASGNQWLLNGSAIGGASNQTYIATASGNYTVRVTDANVCTSAASPIITVTVNAIPATPTITPSGSVQFCSAGSKTLTSSSATGNQWYLEGNAITGETNQTVSASNAGHYTVVVTTNGCSSASSAATNVTINSTPPKPVIAPGGPTTFCAGGSVTLSSNSASGNQWYLNGNPITGGTNQTFAATASGSYTVTMTTSGCVSNASDPTVVTVNPLPATPAITPGGPTTFCAGGSVNLTSSSATNNQWFLNGNAIGGATNQVYNATASGSYTVAVTTSGCTSAASTVTTVTVNPKPNATITAPISIIANTTGKSASVASAGAGATYVWGITGGAITAGGGTNSITFTAGGAGTLTLSATVTTSAGCSDTKSANVSVALPPVTVTTVTPGVGATAGGSPITINGSGFAAGATVSVGGSAATNVVVVSAIKITAKTPAHTAGAVNVTVTNTDTSSGTLTSGFLYQAHVFDPNGDNAVDPTDIFFLINYLFLNGPAPHGPAGVLSGDANGDGVIDPSDIFFLINYLFLGGPTPAALPNTPRATAAGTSAPAIAGSIAMGTPVRRGGHYFVPVIVTARPGSIVPQTMSLKVHFDAEAVGEATVRRAGVAKDLNAVFEFGRRTGSDLSYLVSYGPRGLALGASRSAVVAEIEIELAGGGVSISIDPLLTMLGDQTGTTRATVANGKLEVSGTTIGAAAPPRPHPSHPEVN